MARNGLLIQYEYCTGCHTCEVACKQEHNFTDGMVGIRVDEVETVGPDKVHLDFIPVTTRFCDLCAERTGNGEQPACVKHCQSRCMAFGKLQDLVKAMEERPKMVLFAPR